MTTRITVSVNGSYKIPVTQGEKTTWVSGRGHDGPKVEDFHPTHGDGATFQIGPEEPDNGEPEDPNAGLEEAGEADDD